MSLFDELMSWDKATLAKSLAQHARENIALRDRAGELEHQLFWLLVKEKHMTKEQIDGVKQLVEDVAHASRNYGYLLGCEFSHGDEIKVAIINLNNARHQAMEALDDLAKEPT